LTPSFKGFLFQSFVFRSFEFVCDLLFGACDFPPGVLRGIESGDARYKRPKKGCGRNENLIRGYAPEGKFQMTNYKLQTKAKRWLSLGVLHVKG